MDGSRVHFDDLRVSTDRFAAGILDMGYDGIIVPEIDDVFRFGSYLRDRMSAITKGTNKAYPDMWSDLQTGDKFFISRSALELCRNGVAVCQLAGDGSIDERVSMKYIQRYTGKPVDMWVVYYTGQIPNGDVRYEKTATPPLQFHWKF